MERLEAHNISKSYADKTILEQIHLHLKENELVCLLGASGAGKTTLFNVLSGLELPDAGQVLLDGEEITGRPGKISYMLQKDLLLPYRTVLDNAAMPLIVRGMKKKDARRQAGSYFTAFSLDGCEKKYPHQLSGGMRQRVALLRTYLAASGVALLDEPFSALDTITKTALHKWYLGIMGQLKLSTLFITHDIDEAIFLSDRVYILTGAPGKITEEITINRNGIEKDAFNLDPAFLGYKRRIIEALHL